MNRSRPDPLPRIPARKYRGLGDVVEAAAKPIARVIDRVAGTVLEHCPGCARRRDAMNRRFSLRREPVDTEDGA